ncbi:MAG: hypothetical protein JWQ66_1987 [Mucilaginibacter sp.]|nr:hypothetical protein [Mucilaginibacter sp.]
MKKIYLFAWLCLSLTQLKAQEGVVFKVKYLPNRSYQTSVNIGMKINATLSGDTALINKLKSQGITQPVNANLAMGLNASMKTGTLNTDGTFPINMDFKIANLEVTANGKQIPIPPKVTEKDMKVVGHAGQDGQLKVDSAEGKKMNDSTEKKMQQMMDLVQKQIKFPDKPLKPGDTFTQGAPMNIPVGGANNIQINGGITYKLVSISGGKAYFDIIPNVSMDLKIKTISATISGTGTGKMVYDIKNSFPLSKEATINMKIKVTSAKFNVDGTAVITSNTNCTIN